MSQKRYISPYDLAVVYSGLGRMDEAFRLLDRALEQRTPSLIYCTPYDAESVALRRGPALEALHRPAPAARTAAFRHSRSVLGAWLERRGATIVEVIHSDAWSLALIGNASAHEGRGEDANSKPRRFR